jgi:hypothetical protein
LIQEAALARVRTPNNRCSNSAAENLSFGRGPQEVIDEGNTAFETRDERFLCVWSNILIWKIDVRFDVRQSLHHVVAEFFDALRKFAGELFIGRIERQLGARVNQVRDGFSLREIDAAIQERSLGEFARSGKSRPCFEHRVQHQLSREGRHRDS